ncbi:beta-propeller fold lactonase family protein [Lachnospiraceae bacterium 54-11]
MRNGDFYACFGGFGPQYWTNLAEPNINGKCHELTICEVNGETGEMKVHSKVTDIENPSTLVVSPDQKFIYAGNEDHDFLGRGFGGGLSAFAFDMETGTAKLINQSLAYGASTAYVTLDKTGSYIFAANHGSKYYCSRYKNVDGVLEPEVIRDEGCVCVFKIREDGGIGALTDRLVLTGTGIDEIEHASAHPHSVLIDEEDFVVIPNKGGDNIYVCKFNRGTQKLDLLSICQSEFGSSPRHACFVPGTPYVLIQNEYDGCLCSYSLDRIKGELTRISRVDTWIPDLPSRFTLLKGKEHPWGIDVQLHPRGKFLFNNNTQGVIGSFELNRSSGELTLLNRYILDDIVMSRGIQVDRSGRFLVVTGVLNEKAVILSINQKTGELTPASEIELPTPTALRFLYPEIL